MAVTCRKCGAELPAGAGRCPACLAIIKPPGFFQRLRDAFKGTIQINVTRGEAPAPEPGFHVNFQTTVKTTYKIRDAKTGEFQEYHSLDEVPAEVRAMLEQAQKDAGAK
jgi:hypothetical protein